ncbi:MAG: hypothetical protein E7467_00020 [Ruminococcaceae bacterium]|nr:hypothetical protein [Oscillospiraceae bacterium]
MLTPETKDIWDSIIADYKEAQHCLWCPKHTKQWSRDGQRGFYYLWKAYHLAESAQEKHPLWYARILYMMACEQRYKQWDYEILNFYLKPCIAAYKEAMASAEQPTQKEVDAAQYMYEQYSYELANISNTADCVEQAYSRIEGLSSFPNFAFHDSKVIAFSHNESEASLTLQYDDVILTLAFDDVTEVHVNAVDPEITYIVDFYCYPAFRAKDCLVFDIGFYKIRCRKIRAFTK